MGKTVFITGASSGIGEALSMELAQRGYDLFLTARRHAVLEEVKRRILGAHPDRNVEVRALDVNDYADVGAAISEAADRFDRIDIVIANAGIGSAGPVGGGRFDQDRAVIETNVIGAIATIDAAIALFRRQGGGQIVGISSVAAARGMPGTGSYSASKAAVSVYLDSVRAETHSEPIEVTTLAPGYIDTPLNQDMKSRPFLIDVDKGARIAANLIERGGGESTVPRWPWTVIVPILRHLPTGLLARNSPPRD
jgi:short-subunit dehydrogenase